MNDSFSEIHVVHPLIRSKSVEYRKYQDVISKSASYKNTLVILPTSLGKTMISVLLSVEKIYHHKDKRILIMAPTRPLVSQHMKSFSTAIKLFEDQFYEITGRNNPDIRFSIWNNKNARLIFATPEVVQNDLKEKRLNLQDFSLLVFDEAHRAVKNYAYSYIAKSYIDQSTTPLILAMTASPGSERCKIQEICSNLYIENIEFRTEKDDDVKEYVNPIDIAWQWVDLPPEFQYIATKLRVLLEDKLRWIIGKGFIRKKINWIFKKDLIELGEYLRRLLNSNQSRAEQGQIFSAIIYQSSALTIMYCLELVESQGLHALQAFIERMNNESTTSHKRLLEDPIFIEIASLLKHFKKEHPKITHIKEILLDYLKRKEDKSTKSKILVFSQYRDTATHIVKILEDINIKAYRFVGQSAREGDDGLKQEEQMRIIKAFREGEFDVLVATSIAEEGLDIPDVDLVLFYEPVASEIRFIQRRGRTGRRSSGRVIILATKDTIDEKRVDAGKKKIERMRDMIKSIAIQLPKISRIPYPENIMDSKEIEKLEALPKSHSTYLKTTKPKISIHNFDSEIHVNRDISRAMRHIHTILLKHNPIFLEDLYQNLSEDRIIVNEALKKMEKENVILKLNNNYITLDNGNTETDERTYSLEVEKVIQGKAMVIINQRWHARINYYDYDGPRDLLKKGARFKALGELYREDGIFNIRIKRIIY